MKKYDYKEYTFNTLPPELLKKGQIFSFEKKDADVPLCEHPIGYYISHIGVDTISYCSMAEMKVKKDKNGKRYKYYPSTGKCSKDTIIYVLEEHKEEPQTLPVDDYYRVLKRADAIKMICYSLSWIEGIKEEYENFRSAYADTLNNLEDALEKAQFDMWFHVQCDTYLTQLGVWTSHEHNIEKFHKFTRDDIEKFMCSNKEQFDDPIYNKILLYFK